MSLRKIIHVDMDAFYASVEQRDNPELKGKPVIVGGRPNGRGVVCTASYEARRFGVHSAMPSAQAYRLCPQGIFLPPRFSAYKEASQQIRTIFHSISDKIEPLSLDEAYLDVTQNKLGLTSATHVAQHILREIQETTHLTASAGVAPNKFLAKLGSDMNKPAGLTVIPPSRITHILKDLPVRRIPGIGKATETRMAALGIHTTADIREMDALKLSRHFGRMGAWYLQLAHGEDNRDVNSDRERKSLGAERTFSQDLLKSSALKERLEDIANELARRLAKVTFKGRTLTLKITYKGFVRVSRSRSFAGGAPRTAIELLKSGLSLLKETEAGSRPIRLLGLSLSNPIKAAQKNRWTQLSFPFL